MNSLHMRAFGGLAILFLVMALLLFKFLARNLTGYSDYEHRVHYRLLPGVW